MKYNLLKIVFVQLDENVESSLQLRNTQIIVWGKKPGALNFKNPISALFVIHHISYANAIRFLGWHDPWIRTHWTSLGYLSSNGPWASELSFCSKTAKRNFNYFKSHETTFSLSYFCHANNMRHFSIVEWSSEKKELIVPLSCSRNQWAEGLVIRLILM